MGEVTMNTEQNNNPNLEHIRKIYYWRTAFFGLVILIAGAVIGAAAMSIMTTQRLRRPSRGPEFRSLQVIPPLRRDLGLSQEQSEKIRPLIDGYMKKLQDIRENARTEIENTLHQMNEEISSNLTPPQQQRWQREMSQLQEELRPGGPRRNGMGLRTRRGMELGGRRGGRGQGGQYRRGLQTPLIEPNLPRNDVNENQVPNEGFDPNGNY
jgi:gas vesicle protein